MPPRVIFVVAHDRRGVMGRGGELPWRLPADLKHFRQLTIGKPVVMGRKTYEAIGKPLPRRRNIVLTRDFSFAPPGVDIANSIQDVFEMEPRANEIAIIGGSEIFNAFSPYVDVAYVTEIDAEVDGDVFYMPPQRPSTVEELGVQPPDERNEYGMRFLRYDYAKRDVTGGSLNESKPSP
jgi:dihydrofolate reductase